MSAPGRFAPRGLFARIVLLVVGGLALAQLLSTLLLFDERSRWFVQSRITRNSQRLADTARVLDSQPPERRQGLADAFANPGIDIQVRSAQPALAPSDPALAQTADDLVDAIRHARGRDGGIDASLAYADDVARPAAPRGARLGVRTGPGSGTRIRALIPSADGAQWYDVRLDQAPDLRVLPDQLWWDMLVRLAVLVVLLLIAARWISRPLSTLAQAADRLGRNLDEPPIAEDGPSEVRRAAQAFNGMQVRLRDLVREKARMLAAVSHDLKTPITRLRLRAELLEDGDLRTKIGRDLDEMESMVSATLELMRGNTAAEALQRTDLVALVESLQDDYEDMNRVVGVEAERIAPIEVRPKALRRCLANLVDNALKYAGNVTVRVSDAPDAATLDVEDDGPGIPQAELDRVFEPFYRLEQSRSRESGGSGLGLSIARAIALEHAGWVTLENREGGGLRARVILPRR